MIAVYVFGGILLLLIIAVLVGSVVEIEPTDPAKAGLPPEERQAAALEALREIEFEYQTGKLLEVDYLALRNRYATLALGARDAIAGQPEATVRSCHACGEPFSGQVRFCPRCGVEQAVPPKDEGNTDDGEPA
jgi:rRNA maturation endonuclease Nob1